MRTFHTGGIALHKASKVVIKAKHIGVIKFSEGLQLTKIKTEKDEPFNVVVREGSIIIATTGGKPESHLLPIGSILHVEEGSKVEVADLLAEFDPAFEYIISDSDGKVRMFNFDVVEKKDPQGRVFKVAKGDGEIIVLNLDLHKEFSIPADTEINVSRGDKVRIGTDICGGVVSDVTGVISEIHRSSNPKSYVTVTLGESYPIHAGARILIEDGKSVHADDVLAIEEKTGYDPSKTKDIIQGLPRVEELFEARRPKDSALVAEIDGRVEVVEADGLRKIVIHAKGNRHNEYLVPFGVRLRVHSGTEVTKGVQLTEGTLSPHDILKTRGIGAVQRFLVDEVQKVYRSQGVEINDKHIEVIVAQMTKKLKITLTGESSYLPGQLVDKKDLQKTNEQLDTNKQELSEGEVFLLGITKASLTTKSFLSAASFQETARVLSEAALYGREDEMYGLKENVIIGKLIPAGTGLASFRQIKLKANGTYLEEEQSLVPTFEV
jgi:DNA-directed RNA polymerase subunit beta'